MVVMFKIDVIKRETFFLYLPRPKWMRGKEFIGIYLASILIMLIIEMIKREGSLIIMFKMDMRFKWRSFKRGLELMLMTSQLQVRTLATLLPPVYRSAKKSLKIYASQNYNQNSLHKNWHKTKSSKCTDQGLNPMPHIYKALP